MNMLANMPKTRVAIYLIGIAAQIASFFVATYAPDIAQAFSQTSDVLGAIALGTAVTNLTTRPTPIPVVYAEPVTPAPSILPESYMELEPEADGVEPTAAATDPAIGAKHA